MKTVTKIDAVTTSQTAAKLRVAAYARVSTDSDAQLESLEAQKSHYESYITSRDDWVFAGLYYDEGISGTKTDKPAALQQLISDCEAHKIDYVITKSISRFSRNTTDCLMLVRKLLMLNIPIFFEKENIDTGNMESELFLSVLSSMAESESVSIAENNKWSIQKRFESGTYKISVAPYGYRKASGSLEIDEAESVTVRRIFSEYISGKSSEDIAKELISDGVSTRKGGKWSDGTIRSMLMNITYTCIKGELLFVSIPLRVMYSCTASRSAHNLIAYHRIVSIPLRVMYRKVISPFISVECQVSIPLRVMYSKLSGFYIPVIKYQSP